jgi:hypothetical protein
MLPTNSNEGKTMTSYRYSVTYQGVSMHSHPTFQSAMEGAASDHERHGMPLDRMRIVDSSLGVAWASFTIARESMGYCASPEA